VGDQTVIANHALLGGYVEVGERVFIGGGSVFHQFVRVGRGAIVQGLSAFSKDVPPFTLAAERNRVFGLNVVGLRRAGFSAAERAELKAAFKLLYASGMNISQALAAAGKQTWGAHAAYFFEFAAAARRRGLCGCGRPAPGAEAG
jgi:UDP-N-acetylglucosamine acyltransferase